jgi:hypothetical protein
VKLPPSDDSIAIALRNHWMTEASDAGLRSPSLEGQAKGSSSPDAAAISRASSGRQPKHQAVRAALAHLSREHVNVLSLAYGTTFRDRDIDDGSRRKAPKKSERDWRVTLRDDYDLGSSVAIVFASPFVIRSAREVMNGEVIAWLRSPTAKDNRGRIEREAIELLVEARKAFGAVYVPPIDDPTRTERTKHKGGRPKVADEIRVRAFGNLHGKEIGE